MKQYDHMTKKYQKPVIKVHEIANDDQLLAGTTVVSNETPTNLSDNSPQCGGRSNGLRDVGAKSNTFGVWDDDE